MINKRFLLELYRTAYEEGVCDGVSQNFDNGISVEEKFEQAMSCGNIIFDSDNCPDKDSIDALMAEEMARLESIEVVLREMRVDAERYRWAKANVHSPDFEKQIDDAISNQAGAVNDH